MTSKRAKQPAACPKCGLEQAGWKSPEGYKAHGDTYCCQDCAFDTGCLCIPEPGEPRSSEFKRGGSLGGQAGI